MKQITDDTKVNVYINPNKFKATQPDLTAEFLLAGLLYSLALWEQTTQDGQRDYFSGSVTQRDVSPPVVTKVKLFQFAQRRDTDPDYRGKEPITLNGGHYFLYAWWRRSTESDIWLELEFSPSQRDASAEPRGGKV